MLIPISVMITGAVLAAAFLGSGPYALIGVLMAIGGAAVTLVGYWRQRAEFNSRITLREQRFENILADREAQAVNLLDQTRLCLLNNDPDFVNCLALAQSRDPRRLWERIANDHDFLRARLGLGALPFQVRFDLPSQMNPLVKDPYEEAAEQMAARFQNIQDVPVLLDLRTAGVTGIMGEWSAAVPLARAVAIQLATHHSPEVLRLAAVYPDTEADRWAWMRFLPHVWRSDRQLRYLAADHHTAHKILDDLAGILRQRDNQLQTRQSAAEGQNWPVYYVVIVADPLALNSETRRLLTERGPQLGFHSIFLAGREAELPRECGTVITAGSSSIIKTRQGGWDSVIGYTADSVSERDAEEFSRLLTPLRFESAAGAIPNLTGLFDLLNLNRVEEWDVLGQWQSNDSVASLQVPIGIGAGDRRVMFDIHDGGHGPHGLAAGTSGSGKTRFLECLVAILSAHYHPNELSFMLIDFKGSDFLHTIPELPHCISILSSIEGKSEDEQNWYASRALQALKAESKRRQRLFAELKVSKIAEYHERRRVDTLLPPVPRLIIIVDEFAELATQQPDFLDGLVSLARIGRSLGMHLILSTQQPSGIVTDQIWANSRFRLSMKFNKTEDSQAVLKRPDAAYIEQRGRGYLQVGENEVFELFQAPFGGLPYEETDPERVDEEQELEVIQIALNGERILHLKKEQPKPEQTQLKALVQHIRREAERAGIEAVPDLLPETTEHLTTLEDIKTAEGWTGSGWKRAEAWLCPAIGVLDDPARQLPETTLNFPLLQPDLGRFGHLFVCCDIADHTRLPLRTLVTSLALDHSPAELNIYALDFGNNAMGIFKDLPHLGAVIRITESRRITRLFRWLFTELEERRDLLASYGLTWAQARQQNIDLNRPAILLVVDNLVKWKDETDRREELNTLINEGSQNGIHLILAGESRAATLFGSSLSGISPRMVLGFPDKKAFREIVDGMSWDQNVLGGLPDQGIYYDMDTGAFECRVVTPVPASSPDEGEKNLRILVRTMQTVAEQAEMPRPFSIGKLPPELPLEGIMPGDIRQAWRDWRQNPGLRMPIGLDDLTLDPLVVDFQEEGPHFLIIGPPRGGKTITIQTWLLSLTSRVPPDAIRLVLFDNLRHTLQPLHGLPHVWRIVATDEDVKELFRELKAAIDDRSAMTLDPPVVLILDDFTQFDTLSLRSELAELARQGASRGLHLLASGRTADLNKYSDLEKVLLKYRSGLFVGSHTIETDATFFDVIIPMGLSKERLPRGRGYLVRLGEHRMVQVATPGAANQVRKWVKVIAEAEIAWANEASGAAEKGNVTDFEVGAATKELTGEQRRM
jgi:S-DNA-T family DNA segregation ATPase FtsK/SpoIIIE